MDFHAREHGLSASGGGPATKHGDVLSCYFNPESLPFRGPLAVLGALVALLLLKDKPSG